LKKIVMQSAAHEPAEQSIREAWLAARDEAADAYDAWCAAPQRAKREAYVVYRAAADREDAAAMVLLLGADRAAAAATARFAAAAAIRFAAAA
jgi:hypothetical protein